MENAKHFLDNLKRIVEKFPNKVALKYGEYEITYAELERKTNSISYYIKENRVQSNQAIGILMEKSVEAILSIIGILKSGSCYLPIDLGYPKERIKFLVGNSNLDRILTKKDILNRKLYKVMDQNKLFFYEDIDFNKTEKTSFTSIDFENKKAYIMYTSGSTGIPKGSIMNHKAINNLIQWQISNSHKKLNGNNITLQLAPISFDVSFQEIFSTLCDGGKLILINEKDRLNFEKILKVIENEKVSRVFLPPVLLNELVDCYQEDMNLINLKEVIVAGEQLKVSEKIKDFFRELKNCKLINQYGPTETHVVSSYQLEDDVESWPTLPPIGRELKNVSIYILDDNLNEKEVEEWGELHVGGDCISDGYINNNDETRKRFINHKITGEVIYRTGDIVKKRQDGMFEYHGRKDTQVKIRGYRVELNEIEKTFLQHPNVKDCTIVDTEGKFEDKILIAYVINTTIGNEELDEKTLKENYFHFLKNRIPNYMIPKQIVFLEKFPLTPNGKIDKKSLSNRYHASNKNIIHSYSKSINQENLIDIWRDVLEVEDIDINGSFFDLGGNSLLVSVIMRKIERHFRIKIPIIELYNYPTINKLANYIESIKNPNSNISHKVNKINVYEKNNINRPSQDIAIIGISCKFPNSNSPKEYWDNILTGIDLIQGSKKKQSDYINAGGILDGIEYFDADFFGISGKEATLLDPQHRFFLQCAWEAFEDAGYNPFDITERVGVFAGVGMNSYLINNILSDKSSSVNFFDSMENLRVHYTSDKDYISTRLSYLLNLKGPSINIQTACSTALVSIHLACQNIQNGECEMAVAGTSSIMIPQNIGYKYSQDMVFSHDGKVRAFDEKSTGIVFGDGVGVVILKSLESAKKDNDSIYAVIKGSAVNNDGSNKIGFTAPSLEGQKRVIRDALKKSNIESETIQYIETHGTGTKIGDEIEIKALTEAFNTEKKNFCAIGSVKTNIGHTAWSSGIAGLIKTALALKHKKLLPIKNFESPNPALALEESPFYINKEVKHWEKGIYPRRAGVSAFGLGGTNAHIILEEVDNTSLKECIKRSSNILTISGRSKKAVKDLLIKYKENIDELSKNSVEDICFTANLGRQQFEYRMAITFENMEDLRERLNILSKKDDLSFIYSNKSNSDYRNVFMFTGSGTQYIGMGKELYDTNKLFRETIDFCDQIFYNLTEKSFIKIFYENETENNRIINDITISQVAIFSIEIALTKLWENLGIKADSVIGHSLGEYTAACYAGVFNIEDCINILVKRGEIFKKLSNDFGMISVRVSSVGILNDIFEKNSLEFSIAAKNTSELYVLSGKKTEMMKLSNILSQNNIYFGLINIETAGHSKELIKYLPEFRNTLSKIKYSSPKIKIISTVIDDECHEEFLTEDYWCRHLIEPVLFENAMKRLSKCQYDSLIEIGPKPQLLGLAMECIPSYNTLWIPSMIQDKGNWDQMFSGIKKLYENGFNINWKSIYEGANKANLPTYPFQGKKYWIGPSTELSQSKENIVNIAEEEELDQLLYEIEWKETTLNETVNLEKTTQKDWIIFCDNKRQADNISKIYDILGENYTIILKGNKNQRINENLLSVVPNVEDFIIFLFEEIDKKKYNILYLFNNNKNTLIDEPEKLNLERITNTCFEFVSVIREFTTNYDCNEFWFLSFPGDKEISQGIIDLEDNMINAITKVGELENPSLKIKRLFLDKNSVINEVLLKELKHNNSDNHVLYENHIRKTLKLKDHKNVKHTIKFEIEKDGIYIVTGGLGGIGRLITKWLVGLGVKKIIILNRQEPRKEILEEIKKLNNNVTSIEIKKLDVTDVNKLKTLFTDISNGKYNRMKLKGIFHAAGVVEDSTINQLTKEKMKNAFLPKVQGSWNLHILSKEYFKDLELFVLFSSVVSLIGNVGQTNHAAANAFMDSLIRMRKREGLTGTSINWGAWGQVGYLKDHSETLEKLKRRGYKTITTSQGLKALEYILSHKYTNLSVMNMDWDKFITFNNIENKNMYEKLIQEDSQEAPKQSHLSNVINLNDENRINYMKDYLRNLVYEVLGVKLNLKNDNDCVKSLFECGMDSLSSIELRNKIQSEFRLNLPATYIYENNCIDKIAESIGELIENVNYENEMGISLNELSDNEQTLEPSYQQKRWLKLRDSGYGERVIPIIFRKELNTEAFINALKAVVQRHDALKWYFPDRKIKSLKVEDVINLNQEILYDYSSLNKNERIELLNKLIVTEFNNIPSPYERTPWKIKCVKLENKKFVVLLSIQHIVFDGSSIDVFSYELNEYYMHFLHNTTLASDVTEDPVQYTEYIKWQREYFTNHIELEREYFKGVYGTLRSTTLLPSKDKHSIGTPMTAEKLTRSLKGELSREVFLTAKNLSVSTFSVLLGVYSKFLAKITGNSEIIIATIVNGRSNSRFKNTIGAFPAPFPIRVWVGDLSPVELIEQCNILTVEINSRSSYPVSDLTNVVPAFRKLPIETYFTDVGINFTNYKGKGENNENIDYKILEILNNVSEEDFKIFNEIKLKRIPGLHLVINEIEGDLYFNFYYHIDRFSKEEIIKWMDKYFEILKEFLAAVNKTALISN